MPTDLDWLSIFFRWLHVITACVVIGSAVFMRLLLPAGLRGLEPAAEEAAFLRSRRAFKFVVHGGILLFLVSGVYNAVHNWPAYNARPGFTHGLFGLHVLLGLVSWVILLAALAGREPRRWATTWTKVNLVIVALVVAAASTLKSAREYAHDHPKPKTAAVVQP